jgi:hypothetical protein
MAYPGKPLVPGSDRADAIAQVQQRLNERGCGPLPVTGTFNPATTRAVKLFQARFPDATGQPLVVDGVVGPITWSALFGAAPPVSDAPSSIATEALAVAVSEIGVMEVPPGSNRGPRVDQYLIEAGVRPETGSYPWCAAFVYWCFVQSSKQANIRNPAIKTAGVLDLWRRATDKDIPRVTGTRAMASPDLVRPGFVFIMDFGGGVGHTGFVRSVEDGRIRTVEGNTNDDGTREGVGVFERLRKIASINKGFIDYSGT